MNAELRWVTPADVDRVERASHLFDEPVRPEWAVTFLDQPNHHLCIAAVDGFPSGFVSGMRILHPDKPPEMLLYELGVDEAFRRRGIGRQLVLELVERARELGCRGVWVPVDHDDEPALGTYRAAGGDEESSAVIVWWDLP